MKYAIILASGFGTRFGEDKPKQFIKVAGKTILEHTLDVFEKNALIDKIIIVITPQYIDILEEILLKNSYKKICKVLKGGKTRKDSSYIGLSAINEDNSHVIIHDCARPFLSDNIIEQCILALNKYDAVDVAIKSADTIIEVDDNSVIANIPNREKMRRGQTPQCFKTSVIKKAHELSKNDDNFTDDCGLVVKYQLCDVFVVEGEEKNIKITYPEDIFLADKLFQINSTAAVEVDLSQLKNKVIVVFGGSSGIGEKLIEIAKIYGAKTFSFSSRNNVDVAHYHQVETALQQVYDETKHIDYVVNTAGVLNIGKLTHRNFEDIKREIDVNYLGTINTVKAAIPFLHKSQGSILLCTSSSYTRGRALYSIYSSSKAAIVNLTQALAEELYADNIRINSLNPERTATQMRLNNFGEEPKNTLLDPVDVAKTALYTLLSSFTGQVIDVRKK